MKHAHVCTNTLTYTHTQIEGEEAAGLQAAGRRGVCVMWPRSSIIRITTIIIMIIMTVCEANKHRMLLRVGVCECYECVCVSVSL